MPPMKGQMFRYTEADMEAAIQQCRLGVPTATAAKKFGVPRVTLLNKVKGKTPIKRKMGRTCYVTNEIEQMLATWAKAMVKQGFPISKDNLQDSVKKIVDELNIETPFKNGRPGKRWYSSFLKRHPDLITRQPQNLTASRAAVTTSQLKNWFEEVSSYLNDNGHSNILNEPQRVFNMDETAFFLNPKGNKVLAAKGEQSVYQKINMDEKECYTVLLGGNAAGDVLPPMVIFKYERIPRELSLSVPESWGIGRSDNGWMTRETFYEYICNIFNKWLDDNDIPRPVLLFIDGHTSHLSFHVSKFCSENGIILIALFPNATHLLQPMDVAVFRSLKGAWKNAVQTWRLENIDSPILRKVNFCPLLNKVLKDTLVPTIFQNGFRKCGLTPWNPDEVCCILEPPSHASTELTELQTLAKIKELEFGKHFVEKYIDPEKIAEFKSCDVWLGAKEDIGLFKFYKDVEEILKKLTSQNLIPKSNCASEIAPSLVDDDNNVVTLNTLKETSISEVTPILINDDNIDDTALNTLNEHFKIQTELTDNKSATEIISPVINKDDIIVDVSTENHKTPVKLSETNTVNSITMSTKSSIMPSTSRLPEMFSTNMGAVIPSPFKRALFWPTPKEDSRKRKKEKLPSVISSLEWQQYHEQKDKKKNELEEEKKRRLEQRKKKKEQNEEARKLKAAQKLEKKNKKAVKTKKTDYHSDTSTETEEQWVESGDSMDDVSDEQENDDDKCEIKQGDYVIVSFPGKMKYHKFLCVIQKNSRIVVMAMICCDKSKTLFKENDKDISTISRSQIVEVLETPNMVGSGNRIKYKFDFTLQVDG